MERLGYNTNDFEGQLLASLSLGGDDAEMMEVDTSLEMYRNDHDGDLVMDEDYPVAANYQIHQDIDFKALSENSGFMKTLTNAFSTPSQLGVKLATPAEPRSDPVVCIKTSETDSEVFLADNSEAEDSKTTVNQKSRASLESKAMEFTDAATPSLKLRRKPRVQDYDTDSEDDTKRPFDGPVQLQMHHHHYYNAQPSLPSPWESSSPHERVPYILSLYFQLLLNTAAALYGCYILVTVFNSINEDIQGKYQLALQGVRVESELCRRLYHENRCAPETILPGLKKLCEDWEKCMLRDPDHVAVRSSLAAEVLGLMVHSLLEPMGWKTLLLVAVFFAAVVVFNFSLGFMRAKWYYGKEELLISGSPLKSNPVHPTGQSSGQERLAHYIEYH
ncbi:hypothetical protein BABINDRAFT_159990 [Babjeviella inositovora NRRL Y-12698]|uniref:Brl1/Brr6 domain-containing protein n=1 Tax=Babjeviella inositovora NRRL Y-12698 TaxID=984486 RepID=A0A1E3QXI7_9ASCO|nr:uncharacterized protein BABINDRAFT_159990 [Babjeviella inositovora NRRL Y-12698]ODQ81747.1 hypothetical protein BABINDRAFT_159990 [Babjeviella inositovora NRRL Y-12698]